MHFTVGISYFSLVDKYKNQCLDWANTPGWAKVILKYLIRKLAAGNDLGGIFRFSI